MRLERISRGWTQGYVGQQIGVTKTAVHDIETGRRKPSFEILIKLLILFGKIELAEEILLFLKPLKNSNQKIQQKPDCNRADEKKL